MCYTMHNFIIKFYKMLGILIFETLGTLKREHIEVTRGKEKQVCCGNKK